MIDILIPLLIIAILIFLNGLFVAAEFAIVTVPKTRITKLAQKSNDAKRVLDVLKSPDAQNRYITTAQVGITFASLGLGMYGEHTFAVWIEGWLHNLDQIAEPMAHTLGTLLAVGLLTYLHVVLGEMIPKSLSLQSAVSMSILLSVPMRLLEILFKPFVWLLTNIGSFTVRALGIPDSENQVFTSDELEYIIEESLESGLLESSDHIFIDNIFDLQERIIEQAMTPRNRLIAIPCETNWDDVMSLVCESNKTRYPVYEDSLDQIIGVIHIKDLAREAARDNGKQFKLRDHVRPVIFVPESLQLSKLLLRFRKEGLQLAIALDEFGGTAGLITLEDLVEEVVGEIQDEFDEEEHPIIETNPGRLRVRGDVILDELEQLHNLKFGETEANTVGGYIMEKLGRIPKLNDQIKSNKLKLYVDVIDGMAVKWAIIEYPPPSTSNTNS